MDKTTRAAPKAAKKPKVDPQKKLLITAIKKTIKNNSAIAILENVYLTGDEAIVTDLETSVSIPFKTPGVDLCVPSGKLIDVLNLMDNPELIQDKPTTVKGPVFENEGDFFHGDEAEIKAKWEEVKDQYEWRQYLHRFHKRSMIANYDPATKSVPSYGISFKEGKRLIRVTGDDADQFPKEGIRGEDMNLVGEWGADELALVGKALDFVSTDDLRPAMTGVWCGDKIVATDAHRLAAFPIEPLMEQFILPAKAGRILLAMGGELWQIYANADHVCFLNENGVQVITRAIDAKFPDYKCVTPDIRTAEATLVTDREVFMKEISIADRFANKSTHQICLSLNGKIGIASQDIDFGFEYQNEFEGKLRYRVKGGAVPEAITIGLNATFLTDILSQLPKGDPVTVKLWSPSRAVIINEHYLLMPLMIHS